MVVQNGHRYKLSYFNVRGFGEGIRMIFHYADVNFEDNRMEFGEEWDKLKPKTPFGKLPMLEVDGKPLAQSYAISRYLAKKFGLAGKDESESVQIDSFADFFKDFLSDTLPYLIAANKVAKGQKEELEKKDNLYKEKFKPSFDKNIPILEKLLKDSGSGFFAKSGPSWVDFHVSSWIYTLKQFNPELFANHKDIIKHMEKVHGLPQLRAYITSRPPSKI